MCLRSIPTSYSHLYHLTSPLFLYLLSAMVDMDCGNGGKLIGDDFHILAPLQVGVLGIA